MKIKCNAFFPGEVVEGVLVEQPSQTSRTQTDVRLELISGGGTPVQLPPPGAFGAEVVEATPAEWAALEASGYRLKPVTTGTAPSMHARYSFGNPYAPMGIGGYSVEVFADGAVELVHDRHGKKRAWRARAEPSLWTELARAIETSGFPRKAGPMSAPPGTESFSFSVIAPDGTVTEVGGFGAVEYRDVNFLFNRIVGQMSKDQVLGFELPIETRYVTDVALDAS